MNCKLIEDPNENLPILLCPFKAPCYLSLIIVACGSGHKFAKETGLRKLFLSLVKDYVGVNGVI